MIYKDIEKKHKKIIDVAKNYMNMIKDNEHDINHMNDVVNYTKELLNNINDNIDKEVCIISAYWHDVGRIKTNSGHEQLSAKMLKEELKKTFYSDTFIDKCCQAIEYHKWNMSPKTKEGLLVKDADKLAYLGKGRWFSCIKNKQKLDSLIELLPKLRQEILYFDESRKIYDRDIVNLIRLLYSEIFKF